MASPAKASATKRAAKPRSATATKRAAATKPSRAAATSDGATRTASRTADIPEELAALWAEYKLDESPAARDRLILHYAPLVKYVAEPSRDRTSRQRRAGGPRVLRDVRPHRRARRSSSPGRGNKFETYAIPRIKGAIIDELRAMDWVPRSVRFKAREIDKAYGRTRGEVQAGARPTTSWPTRLGVTVAELHAVVTQISFVSVLALDEMVSVGATGANSVSLLDTLADRRSTRPRASRATRRAACSPPRSTRCPSGRRSSSRCTTSRASPSPRSARSSASPNRGSARSTRRPSAASACS